MPTAQEIAIVLRATVEPLTTGLARAALETRRFSQDAQSNLRRVQESAQDAGNGVSGLTNKVRGLSAAVAGLGVTAAITALGKGAVDAASGFDQLQLNIASVVAGTNKISDSTGKVVEGAEKINVALGITARIVRQLQVDALQTTATTKQLTEAFQQAVGPAGAVGFSLEQTEKFAVRTVQAMSAIGQPLEQIGQEMRSILTGDITADSRLAKTLGITPDLIKQWTAAGVLFDNLTKKFADFEAAGARQGRTLQGLVSSLKDVGQQLLQLAGTRATRVLEKELGGLLDSVIDKTGKINPALVRMAYQAGEDFGTIVRWLIAAGKHLAYFTTWLYDNRGWITWTAAAGLAVVIVGKLTFAIGSLIAQAVLMNAIFQLVFGQSMFSLIVRMSSFVGGALLVAFKSLVTTLGLTNIAGMSAFRGLGVAIMGLMGPIGIVAAALVGLFTTWVILKNKADNAEAEVERLAAEKGPGGGVRGTELSRLLEKKATGQLSQQESSKLQQLKAANQLPRGIMPTAEDMEGYNLTSTVSVDTAEAKKKLKELADYQHDLREIGIKDAQRAAKAEVSALQDAYDTGKLSIRDFYRQKFEAEDQAHQRSMRFLADEVASRKAALGNMEVSKGASGAQGTAALAKFFGMDLAHPFGEARAKGPHGGIDFGAASGTNIRSPVSGTVKYNQFEATGGGNWVGIADENGVIHQFMHMREKPKLKIGQQVLKGETIGQVGETGSARGSHLHYQVKPNIGAAPVNPSEYMTGAGAAIYSAKADIAKAQEELTALNEDFLNQRAADNRAMENAITEMAKDAAMHRVEITKGEIDKKLMILENERERGTVSVDDYNKRRLVLVDQGYKAEVTALNDQVKKLAQGNPMRAKVEQDLATLMQKWATERTKIAIQEAHQRLEVQQVAFAREQAARQGQLQKDAALLKQQEEDGTVSIKEAVDRRVVLETQGLELAAKRRDEKLKLTAKGSKEEQDALAEYEQAQRDSSLRITELQRGYQQQIRSLTGETTGILARGVQDFAGTFNSVGVSLGNTFIQGLNKGLADQLGPVLDFLKKTIIGGLQSSAEDIGKAIGGLIPKNLSQNLEQVVGFIGSIPGVGNAAITIINNIAAAFAVGGAAAVGMVASVVSVVGSIGLVVFGLGKFIESISQSGDYTKGWADKWAQESARVIGSIDSVRNSLKSLSSLTASGIFTPEEAAAERKKRLGDALKKAQEKVGPGTKNEITGATNTEEDIESFMQMRRQAISRLVGRALSDKEILESPDTGSLATGAGGSDVGYQMYQFKQLELQRRAFQNAKRDVEQARQDLQNLDFDEATNKVNSAIVQLQEGLISEEEFKKQFSDVYSTVKAGLIKIMTTTSDPEVKARTKQSMDNLNEMFNALGSGLDNLKDVLAERSKAELEFTAGARDEAGKRISIEQRAAVDVNRLREDYHRDEAGRMKRRNQLEKEYAKQEQDGIDRISKLREELTKSQQDEDKAVQTILNEGLAQRQLSVAQDKQQRIDEVKEKGAEQRKDLNEAISKLEEERKERHSNHLENLREMDEEARRSLAEHTSAVSRIQVELAERTAQHNVRMAEYDKQIAAEVQLRNVAQSTLDILRQQAQQQSMISSGMGSSGGGSSSTSWTSPAGYAGSGNYGTTDSGYIVGASQGQAGSYTTDSGYNPNQWYFHNGGKIPYAHNGMRVPGLGPNEVPIVAESGEEVVSRRSVTSVDRLINILQRITNPALSAASVVPQQGGNQINMTVDMRGMSVTNGSGMDIADVPKATSRELAKMLDRGYLGMVRFPTR